MLYHVIIGLNTKGKRKVGQIISVFEKRGLELVEIRKRISSSGKMWLPNLNFSIVQNQLEEFDAMKWYREKFSESVLNKKLGHLLGNHVELFFECGTEFVEPDELWNAIRKEAFPNDRKFPLMFVVTTSGDNGVDSPFIPDNFDMEILNMKFRTLRPMSK